MRASTRAECMQTSALTFSSSLQVSALERGVEREAVAATRNQQQEQGSSRKQEEEEEEQQRACFTSETWRGGKQPACSTSVPALVQAPSSAAHVTLVQQRGSDLLQQTSSNQRAAKPTRPDRILSRHRWLQVTSHASTVVSLSLS